MTFEPPDGMHDPEEESHRKAVAAHAAEGLGAVLGAIGEGVHGGSGGEAARRQGGGGEEGGPGIGS